jgi:hypothetical protein
VRVQLVRVFVPAAAKEIQAAPTDDNYQVFFSFESEALLRKWATSTDHDVAWPKLRDLTDKFAWRGFDVVDAAP